MAQKEQILDALKSVIHPETGENIVDGGFVQQLDLHDPGNEGVGRIVLTLQFKKARDPFAGTIRRNAGEVIRAIDPGADIEIIIAEHKPTQPKQPAEQKSFARSAGKIIAVASGKGGVGKSTVAANLAVALRDQGFRVGLLDADIYGPSQPKMFGCEDFLPQAERIDDTDAILPAEVQGIKLMSIGFFVQPDDAMLWRGPMATSALRQLIHQTLWGGLDFLLIDMPPGTGDVHLSLVTELKVDGAVIVSTPQQVAVADVVRGVSLFKNPSVNIPVIGIIENMAWFTPAELPQNRYYIFGKGGAARYAAENGMELLAQIPLVQAVAECADNGTPIASEDSEAAKHYRDAARKIVEKLAKKG